MIELLLSIDWLHYALISATGLIALLFYMIGRDHQFVQGLVASLLVPVSFLAVLDYSGMQILRKEYYNGYEFYHYYIGSKYGKEIGYNRLYSATVVAQEELGHTPLPTTIRDLKSGNRVSVDSELEKKNDVKKTFSPARWDDFKRDVHFHRNIVKSRGVWEKMLQDKGYNPPPVWTMIGGSIANLVSTQSPRIWWLPFIDVYWVLLALLALTWAYGYKAASLLFLFLITHYLASHFTLKSAFLRLDWLMALLVATSLMRAKRPAIAGSFVAYAATLRIFPLLFASAAVARLLPELLKIMWDKRTVDKRKWWRSVNGISSIRFLTGLCITGGVLIFLSLVYGGVAPWVEFFSKIAQHNDDISPWRMGFKYVFLWAHDGTPPGGLAAQVYLEQNATVYRALQATILLVWLGLVPLLKDESDQISFSFIPVFVLTSSTYYYFVMLALPFLYFARRIETAGGILGTTAMLTMSATGFWLYQTYDRSFTTFFYMSLLSLGVCILLMLNVAAEWLIWRRDTKRIQQEQSVSNNDEIEDAPASLTLPRGGRMMGRGVGQ